LFYHYSYIMCRLLDDPWTRKRQHWMG
jgi:hypothetical protein